MTAYTDTTTGTMVEEHDGGGQFRKVVLRPAVTVAEAEMCEHPQGLHDEVDAKCFIARSVNFPVRLEPTTLVAHGAAH
jgi:organic hydroperoxide reductase OsmC/OhrA